MGMVHGGNIVRSGCVIAFGMPDSDDVVIVMERRELPQKSALDLLKDVWKSFPGGNGIGGILDMNSSSDADPDRQTMAQAARMITTAVARDHGIRPSNVVFIEARSIPKVCVCA
jgi:hypothetical protein